MGLFNTKTSDAPGDLADELAQSAYARDNAVQRAEAAHASVRDNVIERGVNRMDAIAQLQAELAIEQNELDKVVQKAKS